MKLAKNELDFKEINMTFKMKTYISLLGILALLISISSTLKAQEVTTPQDISISCEHPTGSQTGLVRPYGDGNTWTFNIVPAANVHWVSGPTWQYPDKDNEPNSDWGQWGGGDGQTWLSWVSPNKSGTFSIKVTGKITCGNGGDGEPIDIEADWSGKVKNEINIILPTEEDEYTEVVNKILDFDCDKEGGASYIWNFGDSEDTTPGSTKAVSHKYTKAGTYTVTLTANIDGKDVSDSLIVYIIGGPLTYSSKDKAAEKNLMAFCGQDCSAMSPTQNWYYSEEISAAPGQPDETGYEWQVSANLTIIEGQNTSKIKVIGLTGSPIFNGDLQPNGYVSVHYQRADKGRTEIESGWKVHSPRLGSREDYTVSAHGNGYDSIITYSIIDQLNTPIDNVYIEEKFDVWHSSTQYPNENWPPAEEKPGPNNYMPKLDPQNPGHFIKVPVYMEIASAYDVEGSNFTPSPQNPSQQLGTDKVQYARQKIYIGCAPSVIGVLGYLVADHYLVYYRDHADHEAL